MAVASIADRRFPRQDRPPLGYEVEGTLALAQTGSQRSKGRNRVSGADLNFDGHLAGFFDRLPWTVEVAPRKAFYLREFVERKRAPHFDEINPDPEGWVTSIRVDVDRQNAGSAWLDADLPEPTFTIRSRQNGHVHFVWTLARWVKRDNDRQMRYLQRIQDAYRNAVGGDRGYTARLHHNPLSATYSTLVGPQADYALGDLALYVGDAIFEPERRSWSTSKVREDVAAEGRNCDLFEHLRVAAYRDVVRFRAAGADYSDFRRHIDGLAQSLNLQTSSPKGPLGDRETHSTSGSVAGWTWNCYRKGKKAALEHRQRSETNRADYLAAVDARRTEAREMRAAGLTLKAIAERLSVSLRSVSNYLAANSAAQETVQGVSSIRNCRTLLADGHADTRSKRCLSGWARCGDCTNESHDETPEKSTAPFADSRRARKSARPRNRDP